MGTATSYPLVDNGHAVRLVGTHLDGDIITSCRERRVHPRLKREIPVLGVEGHLEALTSLNGPTLVLRKTDSDADPIEIIINKDWHAPQTCQLPPGVGRRAVRLLAADPAPQPHTATELDLGPAEVVVLLP